MDKVTRNAIERATQQARKLLDEDFTSQLEGTFDVLRGGVIASKGGAHLSEIQQSHRDKIVAAIEHKRSAGMTAVEAITDYVRDAAFTTLNRFVALKMLEARELVQECITEGEQSAGYREFCGMAPGVALLPDASGYRLYIESLFDELSTEIKVLFYRRDPASVLWPKRATFDALLEVLNATELSEVWGEDETIGWVYQYFNSSEERRAMRNASQAPRNSRELAVRNQFFTPRYVVRFLTDNTLGRLWHEIRRGQTQLIERCEYLVLPPEQNFEPRAKKDPRDLRILDPACGSGHFLLYSFDLLLVIYEESWSDLESPKSDITGRSLREDYPEWAGLRRAIPSLILQYNLYGVDIDPRCAQIAQLSLWMRAQRAARDFDVARGDRPLIRRMNVVIAEPMPGEEDLRSEFTSRLMDPVLVEHFDKLVNHMKLAGDVGILLRVEELVKTKPTKGHTGELFAPAEESIRGALVQFTEEASAQQTIRRHLFLDDASQGLGLVELAEKKFDVVLMNPPFGLVSEDGQRFLSCQYRGAHNDVFAAFVRRGHELCPAGYVGVISSRSFLVTKRMEIFRRTDILPAIRCLWDLGLGVMDAASVESAAYVLGPGRRQTFDAADARSTTGPHSQPSCTWTPVSVARMEGLPLAKILYALPDEVHEVITRPICFEPTAGTAREGMKSFDNVRFVRLFWEVDGLEIGGRWKRFAKGGRNLRVFAQHPLVLCFRSEGRELDEKNRQVNGTISQVRQARDYWYRLGATYSRRAPEFAARILPRDHVFSDKGPAVLPASSASAPYLLGWLNSRAIRYLVHLQANKQDYLTGILKRLPWQTPSPERARSVEAAVDAALRAWLELQARDETSAYFSGPGVAKSLAMLEAEWGEIQNRADVALRVCFERCDREIDAVYGVNSESWPKTESADEEQEVDGDDDDSAEIVEPERSVSRSMSLVSWALGVALGRWVGDAGIIPIEDPWSPPPGMQPGANTGSHADVILPDDPGHPKDVGTRIVRVCAERWSRDPVEVAAELDAAFGDQGLRGILRDVRSESGLWPFHLSTHSAQRRTAPVLWRLGLGSGAYSLWLNFQRASRDTLYFALQLFAEPKLRHEEAKLLEMQQEGSSPGKRERRAVSEQAELVEQLRIFRDELSRIAPIWNPNRNDGVVLCFAPLWHLVSFDREWQKVLRLAWSALCAGTYDWAHIAMHLWPERVIPKCATDRSFAIAHGLEDVFWVEEDDGKWSPRSTPLRSVAELVREHTSAAVKASLSSLLEAPVADGSGGRRRGRRIDNAASDGGVR